MGCITTKKPNEAIYKLDPGGVKQKAMEREVIVVECQNRIGTEPEVKVKESTQHDRIKLTISKQPINEVFYENEESTELVKEKSSAPIGEFPNSLENDKETLLARNEGPNDYNSNNNEEFRDNDEEVNSLKQDSVKEAKVEFPFYTRDKELVNKINQIVSTYNPINDIHIDRIRNLYAYTQTLNERFNNLMNNERWKLYDKDIDWTAYSMLTENCACSKSIGKLIATPIEVKLIQVLGIRLYFFRRIR